MGRRYYKPSRTAAREFAQRMSEIEYYCNEHGISFSQSMDSFYFRFNGKKYRVSNHSVEASNRNRRNSGKEIFHDEGRDEYVNIFASKTRLIEVHKNVLSGAEIDGRGYRK